MFWRSVYAGRANHVSIYTGVRFLAGSRDFSLLHSVQTASGAHPASYPMGTEAGYSVVKRPRREADHSPPSIAEVKNAEAIPPLPYKSS
jgi:hypothetical protein